jgi:GT2 family glycosyltransferase
LTELEQRPTLKASPSPDLASGDHAPARPPALFDVSIIIVSFNTREILRECLTSVMAETAAINAEILVVDNASSDGSREMIREAFPQVVVMESLVNLGFGAANNLALRRARGRYFVLLNSDAFFAPGALALALKHMEETPECGLGGCRLIGRDGSAQPSSRCFHSLFNDALVLSGLAAKFPKSKFFGRFDRTWADPLEPAPVDWVPGAFSIVRPSALDRVGFFDPDFFLYYEEVDLCRRIHDAGLQVWYWPDIVVVHIGGESSRQLKALDFQSHSAQVVLWRMRSTLLYYRKHHGTQVHIARWMEALLYAVTVVRNHFTKDPERKQRKQHYRVMLSLIHRAWNDTDGGRVSPPRPW